MPKTQIVFNHGPGTRSLSPSIKLHPGVNYVDGAEWTRLVESDQRVRDLLAAGTNLGLTTKTVQTNAIERIGRGEAPDAVVNELSADLGVLVVAALTDEPALRTIQAKARFPQVAQAALNKLSGASGKLVGKRTATKKIEEPPAEEPKDKSPRNPTAKKSTKKGTK